jgi:hypothetical protein
MWSTDFVFALEGQSTRKLRLKQVGASTKSVWQCSRTELLVWHGIVASPVNVTWEVRGGLETLDDMTRDLFQDASVNSAPFGTHQANLRTLYRFNAEAWIVARCTSVAPGHKKNVRCTITLQGLEVVL